MLFGSDKGELRQMYVQAWRLAKSGQPMSALEQQIAAVVAAHPEYQGMLEVSTGEAFRVEDGRTNPFLHMGLHLAVREQVATNRPAGIREVYQQLLIKHDESHAAEHAMSECLAESLWEAQRDNALPDEAAYLERLRRLP